MLAGPVHTGQTLSGIPGQVAEEGNTRRWKRHGPES